MKNELVSIIIPVYNVEKYLEECIESVLNQTYKNIEVIAIDDGSTDSSKLILEKYELLDKRMNVLSINNSGQGKCRNMAIKMCKGKYVFFLDSDDYLDLDCIYNLVNIISKKKLDLVIYNGIAFYDDNNNKVFHKKSYFDISEDVKNKILMKQQMSKYAIDMVSPCMKIYKREFLIENNVYFEEGLFGEDVIFWIKCCINVKTAMYYDYIGYFRRYRKDSVMTTKSPKIISDRIYTLKNIKYEIDKLEKNENFDYLRYGFGRYTDSLFNKIFDYKKNDRIYLLNLFKDNYGVEIINRYEKKYINRLKVKLCIKYRIFECTLYIIKKILNYLKKN